MVSLPRPLAAGSPLIDAETGETLGEVCKVWPTIRESTPARIRISPRTLCTRPFLRDDMLVHRVNLAVAADGRLLLVGRIDTAHIPAAAAQVQRAQSWQGPLRIVSDRC